MGRRKKEDAISENDRQSKNLICPICGKEFKKTPETYCWILQDVNRYELVCSWDCFKKRTWKNI